MINLFSSFSLSWEWYWYYLYLILVISVVFVCPQCSCYDTVSVVAPVESTWFLKLIGPRSRYYWDLFSHQTYIHASLILAGISPKIQYNEIRVLESVAPDIQSIATRRPDRTGQPRIIYLIDNGEKAQYNIVLNKQSIIYLKEIRMYWQRKLILWD